MRHRYFALLAILASPLAIGGCRRVVTPQTSTPTFMATSRARSVVPSIARFADTTQKAGIHFVATSSKTPNKYLIETMGSGCAFIDYDNDGYEDILLLNGAPLPGCSVKGKPTLRLYHNDHNGRFTDVTERAGLAKTMYAMGCAVGDYDNDGYDDIYITCCLGPSHLYRNKGNGSFEDVTTKAGVANTGMWGTSCAWVDVDRDGRLDLFVCNYVLYRTLKDDIPCYIQEGQRTYCIPSAFQPTHCVLFHNEGSGRFKDISESSGIAAAKGKSLGVAVWDYDRDGLPDLYVANDTTPGFLFHNLGGCRFEEIGVQSGIAYDEAGLPHSGMGIDVTDLNNDGQSSMILTNYSGQQTSLYNQIQPSYYRDDKIGSGVGPPSVDSLGFGAAFLDVDNDGKKDIIVVNGHVQDDIQKRQESITYAEKPFFYRNLGSGRFEEIGAQSGIPFKTAIIARGMAVGDYDNDGRIDVLVTCNGGPAYLWHNETPPSNHWITLKLIGTRSNRDGIGAFVKVQDGQRVQIGMVRSGSSYLSASDLRVHFGLGAAHAAAIEVTWPSGTVDRIPSVATDHTWILTEGSGRLR